MARYNPNRAKINHSYTIEEVAALFGVHKNTVSSWIEKGLPCLKSQRPFLILGSELRLFLQRQRDTRKQKCKPDELFCVRCKRPVKPVDNFIEYQPISPTKGCLVGFCSGCDGVVNKFASVERLDDYLAIFDLSLPKELERIDDSYNPALNSDLK